MEKEMKSFNSLTVSNPEVKSRRATNFRLINYLTLKDVKRGISFGRI